MLTRYVLMYSHTHLAWWPRDAATCWKTKSCLFKIMIKNQHRLFKPKLSEASLEDSDLLEPVGEKVLTIVENAFC